MGFPSILMRMEFSYMEGLCIILLVYLFCPVGSSSLFSFLFSNKTAWHVE